MASPSIGTLTKATDVVAGLVASFKSAILQITGTWTGTITFEASADGVAWTAVSMIVQSTSALATTTTANGLFILDNPGYSWVRARMSSYTSGTAQVGIAYGDGAAHPASMLSTGNFLTRTGTVLSPTTSGDTLAFDGAAIASLTGTTATVGSVRATTNQTVGGTGVPGAATVQDTITKTVTGFTDTTAKDVFTVTVPNAAHAAIITLDLLGILGAGGSIGAGEATMVSHYQLVLARTAGVATVATLSSAIGGAAATVAGGSAITSVVATVSTMTGAVSATQTFTIKVAITRSGAGATNHVLDAVARLLNHAASGVTIA